MKSVKLKNKKKYGKELIMDLHDCDLGVVRSKKKILEYAKRLCNLIKMKKYGKPICKKFGSGFAKGFTLVQLIETSSITCHFSEHWNRAFINIFSCGLFDEKIVTDFTKKFFKARKIKNRVLIR